MDKIVDLDFAKRLKKEGYWKPTNYYWVNGDLPYSKPILKKLNDDEKLNHNMYDFIYSAPTIKEAINYIIGIKMIYKSNITLNLTKR